jgi:hypothetical protein
MVMSNLSEKCYCVWLVSLRDKFKRIKLGRKNILHLLLRYYIQLIKISAHRKAFLSYFLSEFVC